MAKKKNMSNLNKNRTNNKGRFIKSPHPKPTPKKTKKRREKKKRDFESHGQDSATNKLGILLEYLTVIIKMLFLFLGLLGGFWMIYKDIRDNGACFKFGSFEYSGSLVGIIISVACAAGLWRNRAKVKLFSSTN